MTVNTSLEKAHELYLKAINARDSIKSNSISLKICKDIEEFLKIFADYEDESLVPYGGFLRGIQYRLEGGERE